MTLACYIVTLNLRWCIKLLQVKFKKFSTLKFRMQKTKFWLFFVFQDETLSLTHRSVGICTMSKSAQKGQHSNRNSHHRTSNNSKESGNAGASGSYEGIKVTKTHEQLLRRYQEHVDGKALIIFPIAFFLFNIGYWCHYLINIPV